MHLPRANIKEQPKALHMIKNDMNKPCILFSLSKETQAKWKIPETNGQQIKYLDGFNGQSSYIESKKLELSYKVNAPVRCKGAYISMVQNQFCLTYILKMHILWFNTNFVYIRHHCRSFSTVEVLLFLHPTTLPL